MFRLSPETIGQLCLSQSRIVGTCSSSGMCKMICDKMKKVMEGVKSFFHEFEDFFNMLHIQPVNNSTSYQTLLKSLDRDKFKTELVNKHVITKDGYLVPGHNFFSRLIANRVPDYPNRMDDKELAKKYFVAVNLPEYDENWQSTDSKWVGKASMSKFHQFLLPITNDWRWCNAIAFDPTMLDDLKEMKIAATDYAYRQGIMNPLLYVHVHPYNSIPFFHIHILDGDYLGPTHEDWAYKNLLFDDLIAGLENTSII